MYREQESDRLCDALNLGENEDHHRAIGRCSVCVNLRPHNRRPWKARRDYPHRRQCRSGCAAVEPLAGIEDPGDPASPIPATTAAGYRFCAGGTPATTALAMIF